MAAIISRLIRVPPPPPPFPPGRWGGSAAAGPGAKRKGQGTHGATAGRAFDRCLARSEADGKIINEGPGGTAGGGQKWTAKGWRTFKQPTNKRNTSQTGSWTNGGRGSAKSVTGWSAAQPWRDFLPTERAVRLLYLQGLYSV